MVVGVDEAPRHQRAEALPAVFRDADDRTEPVDPVGVGRVDADVRVVERPRRDVGVRVHLLPGEAAVVRATERVLLGLHEGVDHPRVGGRERDTDASQLAGGEAVRTRELRPAVAAVQGDVQTRTRPARAHEVGRPPVIPHRRDELVRVARVHRQVGATGPLVDEQDSLEARARIDGAVDAALGVLAPGRAERGDPGPLDVAGVEEHAVDLLRFLEPEVLPRRAAVVGAVEAAADRRAVARVALAGPDPDDLGRRRMHRHGADRRDLLVVEDRLPRQPLVLALPQAARRRAHVQDARVVRQRRDRRDAPTHPGRPDRARLERLEVVGFETLESGGRSGDENGGGCPGGEEVRAHAVARGGKSPERTTRQALGNHRA